MSTTPTTPTHGSDADCAVDPATDTCTVCGTVHGDPCPACGQRAYHRVSCERMHDEPSAPAPRLLSLYSADALAQMDAEIREWIEAMEAQR